MAARAQCIVEREGWRDRRIQWIHHDRNDAAILGAGESGRLSDDPDLRARHRDHLPRANLAGLAQLLCAIDLHQALGDHHLGDAAAGRYTDRLEQRIQGDVLAAQREFARLRAAHEAPTNSNSLAISEYDSRRTCGSCAQVLMTISSSCNSNASARSCAPIFCAVPTIALDRRASSVACSSAVKPRASISSGDCKAPNTPRARSTRQRSRPNAWRVAASLVLAASAQTQTVACGSGWRSLG